MPKAPKQPKISTSDWQALPIAQWNVRTFHAYFADMNRECYGVTEYFPQQNWRAEQGILKRALDQYGAATLRSAFDECFRDYKPTREYPLLTAGFAVSYRINSIIPRLLAEQAEAERRETEKAAETATVSYEAISW